MDTELLDSEAIVSRESMVGDVATCRLKREHGRPQNWTSLKKIFLSDAQKLFESLLIERLLLATISIMQVSRDQTHEGNTLEFVHR